MQKGRVKWGFLLNQQRPPLIEDCSIQIVHEFFFELLFFICTLLVHKDVTIEKVH